MAASLCGLLVGWDQRASGLLLFRALVAGTHTHTQNQVEQQNKGMENSIGLRIASFTVWKLRGSNCAFNSNVSLRLLTPLGLSPLTAFEEQVRLNPP